MIKFFRKIRQQLVSENKFSKYLLYAIGEILLVVIGILIALQLNNLNEDGKTEATRQNYYNQLLKDLNKDKIYIEKTISLLDSMNHVYNTYLATYKESNLDLNQVFSNISQISVSSKVIMFNTNTIESLENTGDIKLIPTAIRNKLSDLKRLQNTTIISSNDNADDALDILKLAVVELGSSTLSARLSNQPKLNKLLNLESKYAKCFVMLETYQEWKITSENQTASSLKKIQSDEGTLANLITEELKKN